VDKLFLAYVVFFLRPVLGWWNRVPTPVVSYRAPGWRRAGGLRGKVPNGTSWLFRNFIVAIRWILLQGNGAAHTRGAHTDADQWLANLSSHLACQPHRLAGANQTPLLTENRPVGLHVFHPAILLVALLIWIKCLARSSNIMLF